MNKRGETVDEKIKKLDEELAKYKDQIRKTRPGPSQEAIKARAIRLLKHKRMYRQLPVSPKFAITVPFLLRSLPLLFLVCLIVCIHQLRSIARSCYPLVY